MKKYYLAYGSNLNLDQMKYRCPTAKVIGKTILSDYRLVFKGQNNCGYLTIEPADNSLVPLGIFEITEFDEFSLDMYEGYPTFYSKEYINVYLNGIPIKGLIYIMNPEFNYALPTMDYLNACSTGYKDFNFNREVLSNAFDTSLKNLEKRLIK